MSGRGSPRLSQGGGDMSTSRASVAFVYQIDQLSVAVDEVCHASDAFECCGSSIIENDHGWLDKFEIILEAIEPFLRR